MIRGAALVSGGGTQLQSLLDAVYFKEIPNFELVAVISPESDAYALTRAKTAGVPTYVVDPNLFPTEASYSKAVYNKLRDMDIDLVILTGYKRPLGEVAEKFKNKIIGVYPSLIPAFENQEGNIYKAVFERGLKVAGATAYFAASDGSIGPIILQKAVTIYQTDSVESIRSRIMEEAEWKILPQAIKLFCEGKLEIRGKRVHIQDSEND